MARTTRATALLALLLLISCFSGSHALRANQAAKYTWLLQNVGRVRDAAFSRQHVHVLSEQGALAALDRATGRIVWRKEVATDAQLIPASDGSVLITVGSDGLRAFRAADGQMLWQDGRLGGPAAAIALPGDKIAVAAAGSLQLLQVADGQSLATAAYGAAGEPSLFLDETADGSLFLVLTASSQVTVVKFAVPSLQTLGEFAHAVPVEIQPPLQAVLLGSELVLASPHLSGLCHAPALGGAALSCSPQRAANGEALEHPFELVPAPCPGASAPARLRSGVALMTHQRGELGALAWVPGAHAASACAADAALGAAAFAVAHANGRVELLRAADGGLVATIAQVPQPLARVFLSADRAVLGVTTEGDTVYVSPSAAWTRRDGLADSVDALFANLPPPTREYLAARSAARPGQLAAVRAGVLSLKRQAGLAAPAELRELEAYERAVDERLLPTRDQDGFRKQALVLTAAGQLTSLHSGDGHELWTLSLGDALPGQRLDFKRLQTWREPHALDAPSEVAVFAQVAAPAGGQGGAPTTFVFVIDAYAGKVLLANRVEAAVERWVRLPRAVTTSASSQHVFVAALGAGNVAVLPDTPETRAAAAQQLPQVSVALLADEGERVLCLAPRRGANPAAYTKAFGGADVRFKYLNPNLLFVAVGGEKPDHSGPLAVHLLDSVSGRVLWSQTHEHARGPVHAVVAENWAVYHFWSAKAARWQVGSVELYEAAPRNYSVADLAFLGPPTNVSRSAWEAVPVEAFANSFFFKLPVQTMAVTQTDQGITTPQILFGTPLGQLYMMDRRLVDPRRPVVDKPTPAMQAEGLMPYSPELPLVGAAFATHAVRAAGLRAVLSEPTALESATLLLGRGLDIFGARVAPSKSRTTSRPPLLVLIVLVMSAGAAALRNVASRRVANRMWD
ncbi:hypothetical protein QBZ16_003312 [Prototheca wickerhamii]|uniref:ER membrane protein complex subunit 1 n=1 Tax=Prototheca wickerhamii TaxID=3111 RepID=A0AAD9ILL8_PROWI|nr:hypothetical protein QBZ16_003312 [Prototheca wickerhamii]